MALIRLLPIGVGVIAFLICNASSSWGSRPKDISQRDLLNLFNSVNLATARDPITEEGRRAVKNFLNERLSRVASHAQSVDKNINKYQFFIQTFQTKIFVNEQGNEKRIDDGYNYIVILHGSKNASDDEPLAVIANYDTDTSETNPVDSNGSGVVALVALAETLAAKILSGKLSLDRTVILAATDVALYKYEHSENNRPEGARSGAEVLVRNWLPEFMKNRKRFTGAIVLDSIMNFNDETRTQTDSATDFKKAFPKAYKRMYDSDFKGNFLALVQRNDPLDDALAQAFERNWMRATSDLKGNSNSTIKPELINFSFSNQIHNSKAEMHFLKSEQTSFWNHFVDPRTRSQRQLPAILLTDTERYRKADCIHSGCSQASMTTKENLEFLETSVNAIYKTIIDLQTDGEGRNGVASNHMSSMQIAFGLLTVLGLRVCCFN